MNDETFYGSRQSPAGRLRAWLWGCTGFWALTSLVSTNLAVGGAVLRLAATSALVFAFAAFVDWRYLRGLLRPGQPLVTLRAEGLSSPNLSGPSRYLGWHEIAGLDIDATHHDQWLRLPLRQPGAEPPSLPLAPFSAADQERLVAAIQQRVARHAPEAAELPALQALAREHRLQQQLQALSPRAWVTWSLVTLNSAAWALTVALGAGATQVRSAQLMAWGANAASAVQQGEWWRLLSALFLHSGFMHLAMNMAGLLGAGLTLERLYGPAAYLLIYLASGLIGNAASLHFAAQQSISVGASGAVFGVAGALLLAVLRHRAELPRVFGKQMLAGIAFFVGYSLLQGFSQERTDNAAHVGGLLGGCLLALLLPSRLDASRRHAARWLAGLALAGGATAGVALLAPAAAVDIQQVFAGQGALDRGLRGLDAGLQALREEQRDVAARRLSLQEADERSRQVHAPLFRQVAQDLAAVRLRPGDPRLPFLHDATQLARLMAESLAMDSVTDQGRPRPTDPARMAEITREIAQLNQRMQAWLAQARQQRPNPPPADAP